MLVWQWEGAGNTSRRRQRCGKLQILIGEGGKEEKMQCAENRQCYWCAAELQSCLAAHHLEILNLKSIGEAANLGLAGAGRRRLLLGLLHLLGLLLLLLLLLGSGGCCFGCLCRWLLLLGRLGRLLLLLLLSLALLPRLGVLLRLLLRLLLLCSREAPNSMPVVGVGRGRPNGQHRQRTCSPATSVQ